ncbi:FAD:protein FMN transferase [Candidatus Micrarchaeota archaeon]|nr:FAD:protein FMN transferase [Candidatus Micrarchaeota archaeon]
MENLSKSKQVLGTIVEIKLPLHAEDLFNPCFKELERIEKTYSRFLEESELSKLNNSLGKEVSVSDEMFFLLEKAVGFNTSTKGNFDVTLKEDLDALGYDKNYSFKEKAKKQNTEKGILLKNGKVFLNQEIDFGGFGKGFALDKISELLDEQGVTHYYINAGGDIYAKSDLEDWLVLLEHPDNEQKSIGVISLNGKAIAASAPNKRKWGRHHHLLNARTRLPANEMKAVFVLAETGLQADAFATALFTAGFQEATDLTEKLPLEALLVSNQDKMFKTPGFKVKFF